MGVVKEVANGCGCKCERGCAAYRKGAIRDGVIFAGNKTHRGKGGAVDSGICDRVIVAVVEVESAGRAISKEIAVRRVIEFDTVLDTADSGVVNQRIIDGRVDSAANELDADSAAWCARSVIDESVVARVSQLDSASW